jgi:AcrR family transcriptional regulator
MGYDSAETRRRLLDAAYHEFAARGLAGARVDRIALEAGANKQAIYAYFGSKDGLFDAVLETRLGILADRVPFTPDDVPSYVLALFDHLVKEPELTRLTEWKSLEREDASALELESHQEKARAIARAHGVSDERGMDVLMLALAAAKAWNTTAPSMRGHGAARLARHRQALAAAVDALVGDAVALAS